MNQRQYTDTFNQEYRKWICQYYGLEGVKKKETKAQKELVALIAGNVFPNEAELQYHLGNFYYDCEAMHAEDPAVELQAIELLQKALDGGYTAAKQVLSLIKSIHRRQAAKGSARSQYILGCTLAFEDTSAKKAGKLLKAAADQGYAEAEYIYAQCLLSGNCGTKEDYEKAYHYTRNAYEHGQRMSAYNLGCFYDSGLVVGMNKEEAKRYWIEAKEAGHSKAADALLALKTVSSKNTSELLLQFDSSINWMVPKMKEMEKELEELRLQQQRQEERAEKRHDEILTMIKDHLSEIRKQMDIELGTIKNDFNKEFRQFEKLTAHVQAMEGDMRTLQDNVVQSNEMNQAVIDRMQVFFETMDQACVKQVQTSVLAAPKNLHEEELRKRFGEDWENSGRLLASTRQSLVAARVLLDCARQHAIVDCRGVVITATSALERELKARFYTGSRDYFFKRNCREENLPYDLQKDKTFTLGQLYYILDCDNYRDRKQAEMMREYLNKQIIPDRIKADKRYQSKYPEKVFTDMTANAQKKSFTQQIRNIYSKYRNPAAHSGETPLAVAESCCKEVIGPREELRNIEGALLELLRKTGRFTHPNPNE